GRHHAPSQPQPFPPPYAGCTYRHVADGARLPRNGAEDAARDQRAGRAARLRNQRSPLCRSVRHKVLRGEQRAVNDEGPAGAGPSFQSMLRVTASLRARPHAFRGIGRPARCGPSSASSRGLRLNGSVGLVNDDLAVRHLRCIREDLLELLVAHPLGCDTSRLVGLSRSVEKADRAHDTVASVDEEVVLEAGQLAQTRSQALADLLRQFVLLTDVDTFVASHGRKHLFAPNCLCSGSENSGRVLLMRSGQVSQVEEELSKPQRLPREASALTHHSRDLVPLQTRRCYRSPSGTMCRS